MSSDAEVGWIAAIIIGGIAGWLAEQFMKSDMGLLMNIVLGIVGAAIASAILSVFGIVLGGWIGYLILGFIGACLLIWIVRMVRRPHSLKACAALTPQRKASYFTLENDVGCRIELERVATIGPSFSLASRAAIHSGSL